MFVWWVLRLNQKTTSTQFEVWDGTIYRGTLSPGESLRLMSSNQCMRLSRSCQLARSHISPRCCICSCKPMNTSAMGSIQKQTITTLLRHSSYLVVEQGNIQQDDLTSIENQHGHCSDLHYEALLNQTIIATRVMPLHGHTTREGGWRRASLIVYHDTLQLFLNPCKNTQTIHWSTTASHPSHCSRCTSQAWGVSVSLSTNMYARLVRAPNSEGIVPVSLLSKMLLRAANVGTGLCQIYGGRSEEQECRSRSAGSVEQLCVEDTCFP